MTVKRQIINFNQRTVDVRMGSEILDELHRIVTSAVGKPRRALIVAEEAVFEARGEAVRRSLVDAGFSVSIFMSAAADTRFSVASFASVSVLLDEFGRQGLNADDLVFVMGSYGLCSLTAFCSHLWHGSMACATMPTQLDGMVCLATEMLPLDVPSAPAAVTTQASPAMVLCDLSLLPDMDEADVLGGRVLMVGAALAEGKKTWSDLIERAPQLASNDEATVKDFLAASQVARRNVLKAANPSARRALSYGRVAARALARCLGDALPAYALLAEGMRFEARLAVDAASLNPDVVFDLDDLLFDMGIEDVRAQLDADAFVTALHDVVAAQSNRFLLPLPKAVGMIRLTAVSDEILSRHAAAYAASLAE